jgi:hypothetical protein
LEKVQKILKLFEHKKVIIGMVHLLPLPGSPRYAGSLNAITDAALSDALALEKGGIDAIIVENFGDLPYPPGQVPTVSLLAMTRIVTVLSNEISLPIGINVQFNDWRSELAMAYSCSASFVRIEGFIDNLLTDSGFVSACAADAMRYRHEIGADEVAVLADIQVKETIPLGERSIQDAALTAVKNLADAIIVTGQATGAETPIEAVRTVKQTVSCPVLVGSGLNLTNASALLSIADGAIVGSALKVEGKAENRVDPVRVQTLIGAVRR